MNFDLIVCAQERRFMGETIIDRADSACNVTFKRKSKQRNKWTKDSKPETRPASTGDVQDFYGSHALAQIACVNAFGTFGWVNRTKVNNRQEAAVFFHCAKSALTIKQRTDKQMHFIYHPKMTRSYVLSASVHMVDRNRPLASIWTWEIGGTHYEMLSGLNCMLKVVRLRSFRHVRRPHIYVDFGHMNRWHFEHTIDIR